MQARYYDPVIGRFYSNDPVGVMAHLQGVQGVQGFNRYAYVNNNPYKFTDPNGKQAYMVFMTRNAIDAHCEGKGSECSKETGEEILGGLKDGAEVLTRAGTIITVAEVVSETIQGEPIEDDIAGAVAGENVGKASNPKGKKGFFEIIENFISKIVGDEVKENVQEQQQDAPTENKDHIE